jgi:hypothetical protein
MVLFSNLGAVQRIAGKSVASRQSRFMFYLQFCGAKFIPLSTKGAAWLRSHEKNYTWAKYSPEKSCAFSKESLLYQTMSTVHLVLPALYVTWGGMYKVPLQSITLLVSFNNLHTGNSP